MSVTIKDGRGSGVEASVSVVNRLNVSAKTNPRTFYSSRDDGLAFNLATFAPVANGGDTLLYLKNTSTTRNMFIQQFHYGSDVDVLWMVGIVTGIPSGVAMIPTNLNLGSARLAEADAYGGSPITGIIYSGILETNRTLAGGHSASILRDALILPPNAAIAIQAVSVAVNFAAEVSAEFHYEDIGAS